MDQSNRLLQMADGRDCFLTPGKYSTLQVAVIEKFGPCFAPGAVVLYIRDKFGKEMIYEKDELEKLGIVTVRLDKLPDIILYHAGKDRLYFIEAGGAHRAITCKRKKVFEQICKNCNVARMHVTAFPDFRMYGKYASHIAWETEVWIAEMPEHMIHYNGDRYVAIHG